MRPAAIAAVGAGGRFVTPATFVVILLVSVLVLMPTPAGMDAAGRTAVSVLTAAAFSLVWLLVAVLERRLARPSARLALVLCVLSRHPPCVRCCSTRSLSPSVFPSPPRRTPCCAR